MRLFLEAGDSFIYKVLEEANEISEVNQTSEAGGMSALRLLIAGIKSISLESSKWECKN